MLDMISQALPNTKIYVQSITPMDWAALVLICFVLPAVLSVLFCEIERKLGWIRDGDLKLN